MEASQDRPTPDLAPPGPADERRPLVLLVNPASGGGRARAGR
jgi:hypothetical protein